MDSQVALSPDISEISGEEPGRRFGSGVCYPDIRTLSGVGGALSGVGGARSGAGGIRSGAGGARSGAGCWRGTAMTGSVVRVSGRCGHSGAEDSGIMPRHG
jgi:hypothetical protein